MPQLRHLLFWLRRGTESIECALISGELMPIQRPIAGHSHGLTNSCPSCPMREYLHPSTYCGDSCPSCPALLVQCASICILRLINCGDSGNFQWRRLRATTGLLFNGWSWAAKIAPPISKKVIQLVVGEMNYKNCSFTSTMCWCSAVI